MDLDLFSLFFLLDIKGNLNAMKLRIMAWAVGFT